MFITLAFFRRICSLAGASQKKTAQSLTSHILLFSLFRNDSISLTSSLLLSCTCLAQFHFVFIVTICLTPSSLLVVVFNQFQSVPCSVDDLPLCILYKPNISSVHCLAFTFMVVVFIKVFFVLIFVILCHASLL